MGNQGSKGRDGQRDERDFVRGNGLNSHPLGRQSSVSSAALSTLLRGAAEGHVNDKYTFGATLGAGSPDCCESYLCSFQMGRAFRAESAAARGRSPSHR